MSSTRRVPALCFCLLISPVGCATARQKAQEDLSLLKKGMSRNEVIGTIGSPKKMHAIEPEPGVEAQTVEVWIFEYTGFTNREIAEIMIALAAAGLIVALAAKGGGGAAVRGDLQLPGDARVCRFCVGFGADGRLRDVSVVEPVR